MRFLSLFFLLVFFSCQTHYCYNYSDAPSSLNYSNEKEDSMMNVLVKPYQSEYAKTMNEIVGYTEKGFEKGNPEGELGNLVSDMILDTALKIESKSKRSNAFVVINNGGLRVPLPGGAITNGKVFELMPFENYLTCFEVKGKVLRNELCKYMKLKKGQPVSGNVRMAMVGDSCTVFTLDGIEIENEKEYTIFTSDYLASGGDNLEFFKSIQNKRYYKQVKFRDVITLALKKTHPDKPLMAKIEGRMKFN